LTFESLSANSGSRLWRNDRRYKEWCAAGGCTPWRDAHGPRRVGEMQKNWIFTACWVSTRGPVMLPWCPLSL